MRRDRKSKISNKGKSTWQKLGWWRIPLGFVAAIAVVFIGFLMVNIFASIALRHYIYSFDPVDYSDVDRVVPEIDPETGYYNFTTDRDLKIMMFTDIHMGAGINKLKEDKEAVKEISIMLQQEKPDLVILTVTTPSRCRGLYITAAVLSTI